MNRDVLALNIFTTLIAYFDVREAIENTKLVLEEIFPIKDNEDIPF